MKNKIYKWLGGLMLIILVSIATIWLIFLYAPVIHDAKGVQFGVPSGTSMSTVIDDLYERDIIKNPFLFKLLVKIKGVALQLKAGEYLFPKGSNPVKILDQLITGKGLVHRAFTIIPGKTFKDIRLTLANDEYIKHTIDKQSDSDIMKRLGHSTLNPEGQFYPDTYFYIEGTQDIVLLNKAFKRMQDKLNHAWRQREPNLPFKTSYEALTAASIIEKEAYLQEELPIIAGVLVNRLRKNMLLQFDPTVIYGVGEKYDGKIHKTDLQAKNPYNTYVNKGLPPTPISMPGWAAIQATLHPTQHNYYYFVAQSDGSSQFNVRLEAHHKAVDFIRKTKGFFNIALTRYYLLRIMSHY